MLEAARWAPSCFGEQPWRIVVCNRFGDEAAWQKALDCLTPANRLWAVNAPLLMIVCAMPVFSHNGKANRWCNYDTGQAAMSLCLQATAIGLVSHQMGGFDSSCLHEAFGMPEEAHCMAMIAIGYPGNINDLPKELQERERAERSRAEPGERFFAGQWGNAWKQ